MIITTPPTLADTSSRLIVVSNRLPITITRNHDNVFTPPQTNPPSPTKSSLPESNGLSPQAHADKLSQKYNFKFSSGGLVSALSGCKKHMSFTWIGWPGLYVPEEEREWMNARLMEEYSCKAVWLDDDIADKHYNGFANSILWPLFHYHPGEMSFDETNWQAYKEANLLFAETICKEVQDGDLVWVQDYHLMLLPLLLRYLLDPQPSLSHLKEDVASYNPPSPFPSSIHTPQRSSFSRHHHPHPFATSSPATHASAGPPLAEEDDDGTEVPTMSLGDAGKSLGDSSNNITPSGLLPSPLVSPKIVPSSAGATSPGFTTPTRGHSPQPPTVSLVDKPLNDSVSAPSPGLNHHHHPHNSHHPNRRPSSSQNRSASRSSAHNKDSSSSGPGTPTGSISGTPTIPVTPGGGPNAPRLPRRRVSNMSFHGSGDFATAPSGAAAEAFVLENMGEPGGTSVPSTNSPSNQPAPGTRPQKWEWEEGLYRRPGGFAIRRHNTLGHLTGGGGSGSSIASGDRDGGHSHHHQSHGHAHHPSGKKIKIGFFLHTPFPSSEIYRILPVRREILLGILHCDLIGFHTYDYARHFLSSCTRILGLPTMPNGVEFEGSYVHVGTFPIGIEPQKFLDCLETDKCQKRLKQLEQRFEGVKVLVGVDRLDYIKGIPQKLHAMESFLTDHPEYIGKVVLVQVAVPSREDVEEYQNLRASLNELVGRINGRFGTIEYMPIHFLHQSVGFEELCALYAVSDAAVICSTRDGMNLVSYEYVACQSERAGSLILSEFAGAAHSLNGSIIANPWNVEELAQAIHKAVSMDPDTRKENHQKLFRYVSKFTSSYWGTSFVSELQQLMARSQADEFTHQKSRNRSPASSIRSSRSLRRKSSMAKDHGTPLPPPTTIA